MEIDIGKKTEAEMWTVIHELEEGKTNAEISQRRDKQMRERFAALGKIEL